MVAPSNLCLTNICSDTISCDYDFDWRCFLGGHFSLGLLLLVKSIFSIIQGGGRNTSHILKCHLCSTRELRQLAVVAPSSKCLIVLYSDTISYNHGLLLQEVKESRSLYIYFYIFCVVSFSQQLNCFKYSNLIQTIRT